MLACCLADDRPFVISLKELIRKPISSFDGIGKRLSKSPFATALVPSTRFCIGDTSLLDKTNAPKIDAKSEIINTTVRVRLKVLFKGSRK